MDAPRIGSARRRLTLLAVALAAGGVGGWRLAAGGDAPDAPTVVSVGARAVGRPIPPGFVGLSLEFQAVAEYAGGDPARVNPLLVRLIRNLAPGQAPVLRIGGDSTDSSWWPIPGVRPPAGVSHALTPAWLRITRALAAALQAKLVLGVNLAADEPGLAAAEARAFESGIGRRRIEAIEIGNEPDLYARDPWYRTRAGEVGFARAPGYSLGAFIADFRRFAHALRGLPLAGPAFAWLPWMGGLGDFLATDPGVALVTFHRYPLRRCRQSAASPLYGSIANLLSGFASAGLAEPVARFAAMAHAHGRPFRVDELNSVSCHGMAGVSDAFASALWALDTLFELARAGVDGVNIHTFPGASYELFTFRRDGGRWSAVVEPEYYGLRLFADAAPAGARLLEVSSPAGPVKAWATRAADQTLRVVLINEDRRLPRTVRVKPPGSAGVANVQWLTAPGAAATAGVTLGGRRYSTPTYTGRLQGRARPSFALADAGGYLINLPTASAALLTLVPGMTGSRGR